MNNLPEPLPERLPERLEYILGKIGYTFSCDVETAKELVANGLVMKNNSDMELLIKYERDEIVVRYSEVVVRESKLKKVEQVSNETEITSPSEPVIAHEDDTPELDHREFKRPVAAGDERPSFMRKISNWFGAIWGFKKN